MKDRHAMRIGYCLLILMASAGIAWADSDGELQVSGAVPVDLSFDRKGRSNDAATGGADSRQGEVECSGGSLVAAVDCVAKRIEGSAGGSSGSGTRERDRSTAGESTEAEPDVSVTMNGSVSPKVTPQGDGSYLVSLQDAIGMPQFSPGTPHDIIQQAAQDERNLKFGLRRWQRTVTREQLQQTPVLELSFSGPFDSLSLFRVNAPQDPVVRLHWRSGRCDDLHMDFIQAQQDYQEAMAAMPVLQQFELVTRSMQEMQDALTGTAKGMKEVAGEIDKVTGKTPIESKIDELIEETGGLSERLTESLEGVKKTLKQEQKKLLAIGGSGEKLNRVKGALEKGAKTMTTVSDTIKDLNENVQRLQTLVEGADKKGSEQLIMLRDHFNEVREHLGPLIKSIPGLGVFLDLYAQAIEQIAVSAEQIEAEVQRRNEIAREAGLPDPYVTLDNAHQRFKRRQNELYQRMESLANQLKRECPSIDISVEQYSELKAIRDARPRAEQACEDQRPNLAQEGDAYQRYQQAKQAWERERGTLDKLEQQLKQIKGDYKSRRALYEKLKQRRHRPLNSREQAALDDYFKAEPRHEYEQARSRMEQGNPDKADLGNLRDHVNGLSAYWREKNEQADRLRELRDRYQQAAADRQAQKEGNKSYDACVKDYIQRLARENGWDQTLVELEHDTLFR